MDDIEEDDPNLVVGCDVLVQENGHDIPHVVPDLLSIRICPHG